jgi:hypothetical protein
MVRTVDSEWVSLGFDSAEAKRWSRIVSGLAGEAARWRDAGATPDTATKWKRVFPGMWAFLWFEEGFTPEEATAWHNAGVSIGSACMWRTGAWYPEQAEAWSRHRFNHLEAAKWREHGFTAERAEAWRHVGVLPRVARELEEHGSTPEAQLQVNQLRAERRLRDEQRMREQQQRRKEQRKQEWYQDRFCSVCHRMVDIHGRCGCS